MPLRKKPLPRKRVFRKNVKEERSEFNPANFKDHIEVIGKTVLGVVAFCYALGIFVESLYLGSFGVYHVSLFKFTYVFAGAWAILILIIPMLPVIWMAYFLKDPLKVFDSKGSKILLVALGIVMVVPLFFLEYIILNIFFEAETRRVFLVSLLVLTLTILYFFFVTTTLHLYRLSWSKSSYQSMKMLSGVGAIFMFVFFLGFFATEIFPKISVRYGGGKPLTVQLLLEANKQNSWMIQKNFDLCENDKARIASPEEVQLIATKPMPLLLATDSDYIIRKDENTAVTISRDQVKTVLYLDKIDPNKDVCADP